MKRKILYVAMHLSTGGSPQWLLELIKESMLQSEVFVVEFSVYSVEYTIQRDKILDLIGKKNFISLGHYDSENYDQEKGRLLDVIKDFNPDIIHFNEIPENFEYRGFNLQLMQEIYRKERSYKILETCHDNSFDFSSKSVWPDAFIAVSEFQKNKLELLGKTCYLWDYEIEKKEKPNREKTLIGLGLDPNRKHILNVGLFHANKNQKYIYDLASKLLDLVGLSIEFHFVGNECYKASCGIDNLDLPNCRVWGERTDVDTFYSCMDLFLFPTKRELNPLCVKEALSWGMPVIMNKIKACDLYKKYENNSDVEFICDINVQERVLDIIQKDKPPKKNPEAEGDFTIALYTSFYNNIHFMPILYEQIRNQTYGKWKWFITDDFSNNPIVKKELIELAARDERVIYCEQKIKKEMFWNPQHFVTEECDYLALCDADDGLYPKALEFLNHMLKKNSKAFAFSTWFHQYKDNIEDKGNITNSDFSYPQGDWCTYLNKHEEDLKNKGIDWEYLRSFRFFGALRGHKNIKGVEIDINKPEKSVYEDSTRISILQKYGDHILFPRPMYKGLNHDASHASSHNMDPEEHEVSKNNLYEAIKKGESYKDNKILDRYYPFFDELCALNLSGVHHEKDRKNLCLITNKPITNCQSEDIQDLYFDHDFYINEYDEKIDYYFLFLNSFSDDELVKIFNKFEKQNRFFEVNCYCLLDEPDKMEKDIRRINSVCLGEPFSWNVFCRNLTVKFNYERSLNSRTSQEEMIKIQRSIWKDPNDWVDEGHSWSEFFGGTQELWTKAIFPKIEKYLKGDVLEIAPGYGRVTAFLIERSRSLEIVDFVEECIEKCREKFGDRIKYYVNDGKSLDMIENDSKDFVFSWDSFVHIDKDTINDYLMGIYNVLKPGGYAFIHHSHFMGGSEDSSKNKGGRSNMTEELFASLAKRNSLEVISQEKVQTSKEGASEFLSGCREQKVFDIFDCISLLKKPKSNNKEREKVLVKFNSSSLGDSLGWIPYVEEFRKQNDYDVYCFTFNNDLYEKSYPQIKFLSDVGECHSFDKTYNIGFFNDTPQEVKYKSIQYAAPYYLNLDYKEIKPKIDIENKNRAIEGKYICIAIQSTAQAKYWNNPKGWEQTIKYLNSLGYSVVCIDKHNYFGKDKKMNLIPKGAVDKTGDLPLQNRITDIYNCEFFIGLSSGLSWLAWALGKDVILISGFSNEETEFYTPYRVINKDVCNSCWNKEELDKDNWNWCPYHEGTEREFECSKEITFEMVKEKIDKLI